MYGIMVSDQRGRAGDDKENTLSHILAPNQTKHIYIFLSLVSTQMNGWLPL